MKETQTKEHPTKELACTLQKHQDYERQGKTQGIVHLKETIRIHDNCAKYVTR